MKSLSDRMCKVQLFCLNNPRRTTNQQVQMNCPFEFAQLSQLFTNKNWQRCGGREKTIVAGTQMTIAFNRQSLLLEASNPKNRGQTHRFQDIIIGPSVYPVLLGGGDGYTCGMHHFKHPPKKEHRTLLRVQKKQSV